MKYLIYWTNTYVRSGGEIYDGGSWKRPILKSPVKKDISLEEGYKVLQKLSSSLCTMEKRLDGVWYFSEFSLVQQDENGKETPLAFSKLNLSVYSLAGKKRKIYKEEKTGFNTWQEAEKYAQANNEEFYQIAWPGLDGKPYKK